MSEKTVEQRLDEIEAMLSALKFQMTAVAKMIEGRRDDRTKSAAFGWSQEKLNAQYGDPRQVFNPRTGRHEL